MDIVKVKKLDESQVEAFDTEFVEGSRWTLIKELIKRDFPTGEVSFLDAGGGNGKFTDRLLAEFPKAHGTVLDNSEALLARNTTNDRKTIIHDSVENLARIDAKFDVICVHWLLHHLVSHSYRGTTRNQLATLAALRTLLKPSGRISVFENMCDGWLFEGFPGWIIYHLTSARSIASVMRAMGANTAGVGVCYQSTRQWLRTAASADLLIDAYGEPDHWIWPLKPLWRAILHIRRIRVGHLWLKVNGTLSV